MVVGLLLFIFVMRILMESLVAPKCDDHQTRHVDGRKQSRRGADKPQQLWQKRSLAESPGCEAAIENFIFAEETRKRRDTGNCYPTGGHGQKSDRHIPL